MKRTSTRQGAMRLRIAAAAARIMAQDGVDDFGTAKRRAARELGAPETQALPSNEEVEAELAAYRALYQAEEHPQRLQELRKAAVAVMRLLEVFHPYLTGPVLAGTAGPFASIDLQLFPASVKDLEIFLLAQGIPFTTREVHRFVGAAHRNVSVFSLTFKGLPVEVEAHDPRDERSQIKTSFGGRPAPKANPEQVAMLLLSPSN
ncbi:MAG: hypothetical protein JO035_13165 [Betaproteobacteria bacterium]|nr:hypothetical protein [Betaproteobacteria bacterium]